MASLADLVVITCAAGRQCAYLIPLLYSKVQLRLVVNSDKSVARLKSEYPNAEVVQADMINPPDCATIVKGATTVYNIGPAVRAGEKEMGINMVDAAIVEAASPGSRFKHFVYASVLNTQIRKMFNHDDKRYVEEHLILSPLNFTILQPGDFLEVGLPVQYWLKMEKPTRYAITSQEAKSSFIALKDLGEAAAKVVLEREPHYQAQYPLVSIPLISYGEATRQIGLAIGQEVEIYTPSFDEGVDFLLALNFGKMENAPAVAWDKLAALILFYKKRGIQGNPNVLTWLLGRNPTTLAEYVEYKKAEVKVEELKAGK